MLAAVAAAHWEAMQVLACAAQPPSQVPPGDAAGVLQGLMLMTGSLPALAGSPGLADMMAAWAARVREVGDCIVVQANSVHCIAAAGNLGC